jgi:hypothetical protein
VLRARPFAYCLAVAVTVGVLSGGIRPGVLPLLAASVAAYVALCTGLGLWLSVACRTALRARVAAAGLLLVVFGGAPTYLGFTQDPVPPSYVRARARVPPPEPPAVAAVGANPIGAWVFLGRGERGYPEKELAAAGGTAAAALLAGLLWLDACRRFRGYQAD